MSTMSCVFFSRFLASLRPMFCVTFISAQDGRASLRQKGLPQLHPEPYTYVFVIGNWSSCSCFIWRAPGLLRALTERLRYPVGYILGLPQPERTLRSLRRRGMMTLQRASFVCFSGRRDCSEASPAMSVSVVVCFRCRYYMSDEGPHLLDRHCVYNTKFLREASPVGC